MPGGETKDTDYVFLSFVLQHLPQGLVGLLLAVILCAAMSSSSGELAALGSTTVVDFYRRSVRPIAPDRHYLWVARLFTVLWGGVAIAFAAFAALIDNLIQAVNIVGSLFYGTMLGIFLVGFFTKRIRGTPGVCGRSPVGGGGDCLLQVHRHRVPLVQRHRLRPGGVSGVPARPGLAALGGSRAPCYSIVAAR